MTTSSPPHSEPTASVSLRFHAGTIELRGPAIADRDWLPPGCKFDPRAHCVRAPALRYRDLIKAARVANLAIEDEALRYHPLDGTLRIERTPRPFQTEAIGAWRETGRGRGVVVLPTGAGKSHVALLATQIVQRDTLVIAPTLDLVQQWYDQLRLAFDVPVGVIGGGEHDPQPLTVSTYDSAYIHADHLGNRFGLIVFDECHHLPSASYALAAQGFLAPYRLGLTATLERTDGRHALLDDLIGPLVYERQIVELTGDYLAEYDAQRIRVELSEEERADYDAARGIYLAFLREQKIHMGRRDGWQQFVMLSAQSRAGREAMAAYRQQRALAFAAPSKLAVLDTLLHRHRNDATLIFTQDNATAYKVSREFLVPVITHQTKVTERSEILDGLRAGRYRAIATSKVLNEGVDVPSANVAIVMSGSGSVREHVQRLGRILRKHGDQRAVLYELIAEGTAEAATSERRRAHVAYREARESEG